MAEQLFLQREGTHLVPQTQDWAELLLGVPEGVDLNVKITRARSVKQLGTYWGLMKFVIEHGPEWLRDHYMDGEGMSDGLQMAVHFTRKIRLPGMAPGTVYEVPRSKSFVECSQESFNTYFNAAQDQLAEWCGFDPVPTYKQWIAERKKAA